MSNYAANLNETELVAYNAGRLDALYDNEYYSDNFPYAIRGCYEVGYDEVWEMKFR